MARPKRTDKVSLGGKFEAALVTAWNNLARRKGVSGYEGLRRLVTNAIITQTIPGVTEMDLENLEREKWGEVVPTYSGEDAEEPPPQKRSAGRVAPGRPVESSET